jgi:hypothetical protein
MKLNTLMLLKSIICLLFGLVFVLAPGFLLALYGVKNAESGILFMAQLYGATFLLVGLLLWLARNAPDSEALRAIVFAVFVGDAIGFIVALLGQFAGVMNALGWFVVAVYLLLSFGFGYGYYQFAKPRTQPQLN